MREVLNPLVNDIMGIISDIDQAQLNHCSSVSAVFDRSIGIAKRRRIADEIAALRKGITDRLGPGASEEDVGLRLALLILGRDALTGTLGESLHRLFERNPGHRLSEIGRAHV